MNAARTERTPERLYSLGTFLFKHHQKIEQTLPFFFSFLDTSYIPVWPLSDYGPCLQELRRANVSILVILQTYQETALREADGGHPILEIFTRCWPVVWKWIDTFIIIVEDEPVCVELWLAELIAKALMNIQMAVRVVCYEKHTILARGPSSVAPLIRLWFALLHSPTFSESVERPYPGEDKNMTQILLHSHIERLTSHCSELIGPLSAPALILKRMVEEDPIRFIEASVAYLRKQLKADIGSDDNDLVLQIHLVAVMILNVHNLAHLEHCWRILPGCEIVNLVVQFLDLMAQEPFEEHKARSISLAIGIAVRMIREITSVSFTSAKRCLRLAFRRRILYQFVRLQPWLAGASTMSVEHIPEQERRDELGTLIEDTIMPHLVHGSVLLAAVQEISLLGDPEQLQQMDMGSATESWRVLILSITQYGAIQCATRVKCAHQGVSLPIHTASAGNNTNMDHVGSARETAKRLCLRSALVVSGLPTARALARSGHGLQKTTAHSALSHKSSS